MDSRSVASCAVTSDTKQHQPESDSEHFSEHSDVDFSEIAPVSHKQPRLCNDEHYNFELAFQSNACNENSNENLAAGLIDWVNKYQIKHNAVDSLLKILKDNGHDQLPGLARSLIKTARYVPLTERSGMHCLFQ